MNHSLRTLAGMARLNTFEGVGTVRALQAAMKLRGHFFFSNELREYFGSRVLRIATAAEGLALVVMETCPLDTPVADAPYDRTPVFRVMVFDCAGEMVGSPPMRECASQSRSETEKEFKQTIADINADAHGFAVRMIERQQRQHELALRDLGTVHGHLTGPAPEELRFYRMDNDVNGNPRYVVHFLALLTRPELDSSLSVDDRYARAVTRANAIGGRKYNNRKFGGGIIFQSYSIQTEAKSIGKLTGRVYTAVKA